MKHPYIKYPWRKYTSAVNSNPDTWGMCRSENMARKCELENYQRQWRSADINLFQMLRAVIIGLLFAVVTFNAPASERLVTGYIIVAVATGLFGNFVGVGSSIIGLVVASALLRDFSTIEIDVLQFFLLSIILDAPLNRYGGGDRRPLNEHVSRWAAAFISTLCVTLIFGVALRPETAFAPDAATYLVLAVKYAAICILNTVASWLFGKIARKNNPNFMAIDAG